LVWGWKCPIAPPLATLLAAIQIIRDIFFPVEFVTPPPNQITKTWLFRVHKMDKNCQVTLWLNPSLIYVSFGDTMTLSQTHPSKSVIWEPLWWENEFNLIWDNLIFLPKWIKVVIICWLVLNYALKMIRARNNIIRTKFWSVELWKTRFGAHGGVRI